VVDQNADGKDFPNDDDRLLLFFSIPHDSIPVDADPDYDKQVQTYITIISNPSKSKPNPIQINPI
jgi:hypothetical protein